MIRGLLEASHRLLGSEAVTLMLAPGTTRTDPQGHPSVAYLVDGVDDLASKAGFRQPAQVTSVPSFGREVATACPARIDQASQNAVA